MARTLVLLCHADPSVLPLYRAAFADRKLDVDLVLVNHFVPGKLSSAYTELAAELRRNGSILPGLLAKFPPPRPWAEYGARVVASFSAGYALWAEVFKIAGDVAQLDGYVGIDSFHAPLAPDHTASASALSALAALALSAKEGPRVLWYGHTDVQTPQAGPSAYASTTQVAAKLDQLAGGTGGGFRIEAYNLETDQMKEHEHALTVWGPGWLADAVVELWNRMADPLLVGPAVPPSRPEAQASLGARALEIAKGELAAGHNEVPPGSNAGEWVELYFAGAERDGKPLGLKAGDWCAGGASYCAFKAADGGGTVPHRWRAAVVELWRDACSSEFGSARAVEAVRAGRYEVQVGDLAILTRGGYPAEPSPNPDGAFTASQGKGHVARVMTKPDVDGLYDTLDANHGAGWGLVARRSIHDEELVGFISYAGDAIIPSDYELAQAARLIALSDQVTQGVDGLDGLDAIDAPGTA